MPINKKKLFRKLKIYLNRLFSRDSFTSNPRIFEVKTILIREVRLENGRMLFLTDSGLTDYREVVSIVNELSTFSELASYSDISKAAHDVVSRFLSCGQVPRDAEGFFAEVEGMVSPLVEERRFAFPLFGVGLEDGTDQLSVGPFDICKATIDCLHKIGMPDDNEHVHAQIEAVKHYLLLVGSATGTKDVALDKFRYQAKLFAGVLAVIAAANYERGAAGFRIGIITSPETGHGKNAWFGWGKASGSVESGYVFARGQPLELSQSFITTSAFDVILKDFLGILEKKELTEIEGAIVNSIYWFSDAHLDEDLVMRFVKYFTCIESFFSYERRKITRRMSKGIAAVLVYGGLGFVPKDEYSKIRKRIESIYEHRSSAVHQGLHKHVRKRDVDELSQWASWVILTMLMASRQGLKTLSRLKEIVEQVDTDHSSRTQA